MSPIKAAKWVFMFVASLAVMFGLAFGLFLAGAYGVSAYQNHSRTKRFEACMDKARKTIPPPPDGSGIATPFDQPFPSETCEAEARQ